MHLDELFITLAVILVTASFTTILFKWLRQPLVLGYILTGFIVGSQLLVNETLIDNNSIVLWGEIGVIFLLFGLGLEFNFKKLKKVGRSGAVSAIIEALFMIPIGYGFGQLMGWNTIESIFLGGMLSISSTSIVIKAFEDLKLKSKRFTQIVFGILIAEDIIAVLLMVMLTSIGSTENIDGQKLALELGKLLLFIFLWFSGGIFIFPTLMRRIARFLSDEILLIVTIGLCFAMVVIAAKSGFSTALGAFLMGVIIAETDEQERILRIITPLRQLFASVFFISVGMLVDPKLLAEYIIPIAIISGVVLIIKPIIASLGLIISGQPLRLSIQSGFSLGQIGEFSFIIAAVGLSFGVLHDNIYPIIVSVSVITTFATPYFMRFSVVLYNKILSLLPKQWSSVTRRNGSVSAFTVSVKGSSSYVGRYIVTLVINIIWLAAILLFTVSTMTPIIYENVGTHWSIKINIALFSLIVMSPFMYAIMVKEYDNNSGSTVKFGRTLVIIMRYIINFIFVFIVIVNQFNNPLISFAATLLFILVFILLSHVISKLYHRMEGRFLFNLDKSKKHKSVDIPLYLNKELHTDIFKIPSDSIVSGHTIRDIHRKFKSGVQILAIHRRGGDIELPSNGVSVHSDDVILVIGNDEQILHFKNCVDSISESQHKSKILNMKLYHFIVEGGAEIVGHSAHVSDLHTTFNFILVGYITGDDNRFTRPNPKHTIKVGDILWVVGNKS